MNALKSKIQNLRTAKGLTQKDMARVAGVTEVCYQRYEYGERIPDATTAILIADALGTTVKQLWGTGGDYGGK